MSTFDEWCHCTESMIRCLTAITPVMGDSAFGRMMNRIQGGDANPEVIPPEGVWFRSSYGERESYIFIGPDGQDHHFQVVPPAGVNVASMKTLPAPEGWLWREIDMKLREALRLAAGDSPNESGPAQMVCETADKPRAHAIAEVIRAVKLLPEPETAAMMLRQSAHNFLTKRDGFSEMLEAACSPVMAMRDNFVVDAPVWAVIMLRREMLTRIVQDGPVPSLAFKLFDVSGVLSDPEEAIRQAISDMAQAGHGYVVMAVCDWALEHAESAVQAALDAQNVRDHQAWLYKAAGHAFAAMRVAEVMKSKVAPLLWPAEIKDAKLGGYIASTEEIVVRAHQALVVACINAGNRSAFRQHKAQVKAGGERKADELIEDYWFYPRAARDALLR